MKITYYQNIVYSVCNSLDVIDGKKPGAGIVCGTANTPNTNVQDRMQQLAVEVLHLRQELQRAYRAIVASWTNDGKLNDAQAAYHAMTIAAAVRYIREDAMDGSDWFEGKDISILHSYLR